MSKRKKKPMTPFLTLEALLQLVAEGEEPARSAALEAVRLYVELDLLRQGVSEFSKHVLQGVPRMRQQGATMAAAVLEQLATNVSQLSDWASGDVEETLRQIIGSSGELLRATVPKKQN